MSKDKIIALLNLADPEKNENPHERRVALSKARKEMEMQGESFHSLGFSLKDAVRIGCQRIHDDRVPARPVLRTKLWPSRPKINDNFPTDYQGAVPFGEC